MKKIISLICILMFLLPTITSATMPFYNIKKESPTTEYQKKFIFGTITHIVDHDAEITFTAVNIRTISFSPFTFIPYISNETITISTAHLGILKEGRIFGIFLLKSTSNQDVNFPIYLQSDLVQFHWYNVIKTWDMNGTLINLTVKILLESIVNRTISINITYNLYNEENQILWTVTRFYLYMPPYYQEQFLSNVNIYTYTGIDVKESAYAKIIITEINP